MSLIHSEGANVYINGRWHPSADGRTFDCLNPATGEVLARVADAGESEARAAVAASVVATQRWRATPGWQRYEFMRDAVAVLRDSQAQLASLITAETGKPLSEARAEARQTARFFEWFSHETMRLPGSYWPDVTADRSAIVLKEPVGVVAAITPWNYPGFLVACKIGAAIAAGCAVILKPAQRTPLTALAIAGAFERAGLPAGVLNVLPTSRARIVSDVLLSHRDVDCVSFTGSREVGQELVRGGAATVKRVLLELGGNAAAVVLEDADLDLAARDLVRARFINAGQACVAANRVYVVESVAEEFTKKLVVATAALRVGNPLSEATDVGPLIDMAAVERLEAQIRAAVSEGGQLVAGGRRIRSTGASAFMEPGIVSATADGQPAVFGEELFGPLLALVRCHDEEEAVSLANATDYGLSSYVFTRDHRRALSLARRLRTGSVAVNCALVSEPQLPFGGVRQSGIGRERGRVGVEEYLESKTIQLGI